MISTKQKYLNKIVVTGSSGFLGRHLMPILNELYGNKHVIGLSSKDFNLLNENDVIKMFERYKPEYLIHLAAYSGGIGANAKFPADFYHKNSLFVTHLFHYASKYQVKKMIYTMGGCSYPSNATSPISEDQMWNGFPQIESSGYSVAKKLGIVASQSYRKQYGLNSNILIPGNLYGEYDNFKIDESHVIPAMIRRFFECKIEKKKEINMWGDGSPIRDFVYAKDVAELIPWFLENYNTSDPINISSGMKTKISELAYTIKNITSYDGKINWDTSKPNGQLVKVFDTKKMKSHGLRCPTTLDQGLERTFEWFSANYKNRTNGIRI